MTIVGQNYTMFSGDSKVITVTVTDADGAAVNLTGATISYVIFDDGSATITKTVGSGITVTDAAAGTFTITLAASDTASLAGAYYHECQVTDSSGNISTIFTGTVTMNEDMI